ncbi:hypothetical protein UlMin_015313 [Ulmus minor]
MKVKALSCFKSKLFKPCKRFFPLFKFKLKKPVFLSALKHRPGNTKIRRAPRNRVSAILTGFCSGRKMKEMDRLVQLKSFSERGGGESMLFPSPLTPAYVKQASKRGERKASGVDEVEEACRSFENYLVEMIVEEGKLKDLMDVEELLYCWKNLKCPVFIDLVSRFYGELCKDLFSAQKDGVQGP